MSITLSLHLFATLFMTGLIWFVQLVHYPMLARVSAGQFVAFEQEHIRRVTWVVAPAMLLEALTATWLAVSPPAGVPETVVFAGFGLLVVIWISTALIQAPCHTLLATKGFSQAVHCRLVRSNWLRTFLWTARAGIALAITAQTLVVAGKGVL